MPNSRFLLIGDREWIALILASVTACALQPQEGGERSHETATPASSPPAMESRPRIGLGVRPETVPREYIETPNGYFHPSCIISLDASEALGRRGITGADGSSRRVAKCSFDRFDRVGRATPPPSDDDDDDDDDADDERASGPPTPLPSLSGWVVDVTALTSPVGFMSATWTVPRAPTRRPDAALVAQTVYYFPGLTPASNDTIVQPVLGWNGNGSYNGNWTISSWNCCKYGNAYHGATLPALPGDVIRGEMEGRGCANGACSSWQIRTINVTRNQTSTLDTAVGGQPMTVAIAGALEVFRVGSCADLPSSGSVQFANVVTRDTSGAMLAPPYAPRRWRQECEATATFANAAARISTRATTLGAGGLPVGNDLMASFAGYGLWSKRNDGAWSQVHPIAPRSIANGDSDGNGVSDVLVDFGAPHGLHLWRNGSAWQQVHGTSAEQIVPRDTDGNLMTDYVIDFGPSHGLWEWMNGQTWRQIHGLSPRQVIAAKLDAGHRGDLVADWPGYGLFTMGDDATWKPLHGTSAEDMIAGDLDGNGTDEIVIDFGPAYGIWIRDNMGSWRQLHGTSGIHMAVGNFDTDPRRDLVVDFGAAHGLWMFKNNVTWTQLHGTTCAGLRVADVDRSGIDDLLVNFGSAYGLWALRDGSRWVQEHALSPTATVDADLDD